MPIQYPPLTKQVGLPKDKSAKEQLLALLSALGQMPTPMGMASESGDTAKMIAEWLAKNKGGQAVEETVPKLLEQAPKVAETAPAEGGLTMEKLQQMAAQAPKQSVNPPAMGAPAGGMGMEQAATQAPKVAKKGGNKIAQQISTLAGKTPSRAEVQAGLQHAGNPDAMQQEFNALRELLDSARKLKAKGIESQIGNLYGDMMAGGGQRSPTSQATLDHVAMQRKLIQHQLQRLLDALGGKK